jgi:hypothetical protein
VNEMPKTYYAVITVFDEDDKMRPADLEIMLPRALQEASAFGKLEVTVYESPHDLWAVEG